MSRKKTAGLTSRQTLGLVTDVYTPESTQEVPTTAPPSETLRVTSAPECSTSLIKVDDLNIEPVSSPGSNAVTGTIAASGPNPPASQKKEAQSTSRQFGKYELVWEVRKDALSTTYAARNDGIEHLLAVRIFSARVTDTIQVRGIQKAASRAAELTHTNLVSVYESGIDETGAPYIVTDWVEGDSLAEVFQAAKRLDIARFLNIFNQACDALMEAHSHQLVHGNISPNKIILAANEYETELVKIIDFGMPPDPVQNAFYLSPEQRIDSTRADARTDIYSLGCVMYEALVGTPPYVGHKMSKAALNYLHELANQYSPDSPEHNALKLLDCIIIKCLQQDPSKRFRNIRELQDAMRLVNDCICGGNTRKLPPKAEKLLLFRFLDYFDKKIVAGAFIYILLAGISLKFVGENQLQKYIDEASTANSHYGNLQQEYWRAAIQQAEWLGKPPSLLANLHWELGNSLDSQRFGSVSNRNSKLTTEMIKEYKEALKYYDHGIYNKANTLGLLNQITSLIIEQNDDDLVHANREGVLKQARLLLKNKKFADCGNLCAEFLRGQDDVEIAYCASSAYNELGTTLPPAKGVRFFEKAIYYVTKAEADETAIITNLGVCMMSLGLNPALPQTHAELATAALAAGDTEATLAELRYVPRINDVWSVEHALEENLDLAKLTYGKAKSSPLLRQAIEPLLHTLSIEEKQYGLHDEALRPTLRSLAMCYLNNGEDQKALQLFDRLESITVAEPRSGYLLRFAATVYMLPPKEFDDQYTLVYADLLCKHGQYGKAREILEKRVLANGRYDHNSPLFISLMRVYDHEKLYDRARFAAIQSLTPVIVKEEFDVSQPAEPTDTVESASSTEPLEHIPNLATKVFGGKKLNHRKG